MKVSVLVPVYNLERFIEPCLESLLTQQVNFDYEVIAIDDGSRDGSWAIMQRLAERYPQLRALQNPQNIGLAGTQKRLLGEAQGEYIAYVDGDDLALPGKLQTQADYLDAILTAGSAITRRTCLMMKADGQSNCLLVNFTISATCARSVIAPI